MKIIKSESCHYVDNRILITIYITHKCNYSCHYCYDAKNRTSKNMLISELQLFLKNYELCVNKECQVHLIGGEPTLHPEFEKICYLCNTYDFIKEVWVTTNGSYNTEKWKLIHSVLKEKLLIITSYHPSNPLGIEYYMKYFNELKSNNIRANIPFMLDTRYDFETLIEQYNSLNIFGYELRTCTLEPTSKYPIEDKYFDWVNTTFFDTNRFLDITYEDGHKEKIPLSTIYKTEPNMFFGMKCKSLENKWILTTDMKLNSSCDLNQNNYFDALNISEFRKFLKMLKNKRCNKQKCDNSWAHYYKEL